MDNSLLVEGLNIAELSDDELAERLQNLGFNPGPILATTRTVYQRKLARLMRNESFDEPADVDDADDYSGDAEVRPSPVMHSTFLDSPRSFSGSPPSFCASPPTLNYDDLRRRPLPRDSDMYSPGPSTSSPQRNWSVDDIVTQVAPPPGEIEKPLLSPTAKLIVVVILILFALFVYSNMESTPVNPFNSPPDSV